MNKITKYIIIALVVTLSTACVICVAYFTSADVLAVYTRNNLSWNDAELLDDGSIDLDLTSGDTTIRLKNDVKGTIGYNIYLYTKKDNSDQIIFSAKDITEIKHEEYPSSLEEYHIKGAYRGYLDGNKKKDFKIKSSVSSNVRLLMIIEDNNSYPRQQDAITPVANLKFSAEVLIDGQYPRGDDYTFSLKDEKGDIIETVHNDDGFISFSNFAVEKGTYTYYIYQNEGNDKETDYDYSIYEIQVVAEEKNNVSISYKKNGNPIETLPRFSNYKHINNQNKNTAAYPINEKKEIEQPADYLLISTLIIAVLLILLYIVIGKKKG